MMTTFLSGTTPLDNKLPEKLNRLGELAYNLWWSWTPEARNLFRQLDYPLWRATNHNPVHMLQSLSAEKLAEKLEDGSFMLRYNQVVMRYEKEMSSEDSWFNRTYPELKGNTIAYFSFEFGLHNSLPIYSGGLGILSGDHTKEASDLGLPFVCVGFMYPQGYFRQRIPSHGWQEAVYQQLDMSHAPIQLVYETAVDGQETKELKISLKMAGRQVFAKVWRVQVGRVPLFLLDTDVEENDPWDRELSARLYSGDSETRIRQEIMLGVGGVRLLRALGFAPSVWHMNEGHSAFLTLECIRERMAQGGTYAEAAEAVFKNAIFTTHTPVPAGHDTFSFQLVEQYFAGFWDEMGISREDFLRLGGHQEEWGVAFNMTVLALRTAGQHNAVSKLHGEVSRKMWREVWPGKPEEEVPITSITNGVHMGTWVAGEVYRLFNRHFGPDWVERQDDATLWQSFDKLPLEELWHTHQVLKHKLLAYLRERARERWVNGRNDPNQLITAGTLLDPDALTIGFARRFATYKRANLIFRDLDRLLKILLNTYRPVQIIFAGKAHPADEPGKALIQQVYNLAKHPQVGGRIAFVEDYDMNMARYLTQGVDIWLNTPRRPREASGTSGMKTVLNGIPNLSILDGWWAEGYNGANGWAIGDNKDYADLNYQDDFDANSLYQLLEQQITPLFYDRDRDNVPRGWAEVMRETMRTNIPRFCIKRMVKEYTSELYVKAMRGEVTRD